MLAKLLPYLKPYKLQLVWALAQVFLIAGFELLKPWPLQVVIDNVLGGKPFPFADLMPAGIGWLLLESTQTLDFPVVQAEAFVIAILVFMINALVDLSFRYLDPRLRTKGT